MTRDEVWELKHLCDDVANSCAYFVEDLSIDDEHDPSAIELADINFVMVNLDNFRQRMNVKYGAGTI